jgi:hypothetical protein
MKKYGGVDLYIHAFLISALDGCKWSASGPGRFASREKDPVTHWIGGWVGPTAGLAKVEKRKILLLPGPYFDLSALQTVAAPTALPRLPN